MLIYVLCDGSGRFIAAFSTEEKAWEWVKERGVAGKAYFVGSENVY